MKLIPILLLAFIISKNLNAAEIPTTTEVNKVLNYYYNGQGQSPLLIDVKFCADIGKEGEQKNECSVEIEKIEKETEFFIWMNFLVPMKDTPKILMQFNHKGVTRDTRAFQLTGAIRFRIWKKIKLEKQGEWEVPVYHDNGDKLNRVSTFTIQIDA